MCRPRVRNKRNGIPAGAVYIGRGSKWGNPFRIAYHGREGGRGDVIVKYFEYLKTRPDLIEALDELKGKDLLCYCAPLLCHGDILLLLANASPEEREAMLGLSFDDLFGEDDDA